MEKKDVKKDFDYEGDGSYNWWSDDFSELNRKYEGEMDELKNR